MTDSSDRHADPSITLRVCAHVIRQHAVGAAEVFARQLKDEGQALDEAYPFPSMTTSR